MKPENLVHSLALTMIITGVITFSACLVLPAPYGRYSTGKGWGPLVPAKLAWFVMESPNLWVPAFVYILYKRGNLNNYCNLLLFCCFLLHYVNRAIIYPLRMVQTSKPMPLTVCILAFMFCTWNGLLQSMSLIVVQDLPDEYIYDIRFTLGISLFIIGMCVNIYADDALMRLKSQGRGYMIPRGGLFDLVSCPNYCGEIIEWFGFALACWSIPAFAFAFYTFSNIGPRGYQHHLWYQGKFDEYPKDRKAVIPFVF
jgi:hypothetical protein